MMRWILLTLFTGIPTLAQAQADTLLVHKGDSLEQIKKYDEAIVFYTKAIKLNPKNEKAYRGRGYIYRTQNKMKLAEPDFLTALKLNPGCIKCLINLSFIKIALADTAAAAKYLEQAVATDNKSSIAYSYRGRLRFDQNKNTEAMNDFNKAIQLDSTNADAFYFRALLYIQLEDYESGAKDLSATIRLAPEFSNAWYQRGIYYANKQQWDQALNDFTKAAAIDSLNSNYYNYIANVYLYKNEPVEAIKYYSKAIALDKNNYEAIFYRATATYRMENMDASCADLALMKSRLPAKIKDEQLQILKDDMESQLADYCDTSFAGYYYQRGVAAYNLGQFLKAIEWYDKGLKKFPAHFMMTDFKGNAFLSLNRNAEAEEWYTKALVLKGNALREIMQSPNYKNADAATQKMFTQSVEASTYSSRAEARAGLGNAKAALDDANSAIGLMPQGMPEAEYLFNTRGIIYLNQNDNSNALSDFNKALQINPDFSGGYVNRAMVKINLAYKTKYIVRSFSLQNRNINARFDLPALKKETVNKDNLEAALSDCNKAIQADANNANAWYTRAVVKLLLGEGDYCYDLFKAEKLGSEQAVRMIGENKCR
jgi:tetratricopeptide (TPR) repeat protein